MQKPFCPRRTRRGTENFKTFFVRGGRGEMQKPFCPRRTRRGTENFKTFFVRGGAGGTSKALLVHGGHGGARRTATSFLSAEGRGELQKPFLSTEDTEGAENFNIFFVRGGRGELQNLLSTEDGEGAENCSTSYFTRRLRSSLPWLPKLKRMPTWRPVAFR